MLSLRRSAAFPVTPAKDAVFLKTLFLALFVALAVPCSAFADSSIVVYNTVLLGAHGDKGWIGIEDIAEGKYKSLLKTKGRTFYLYDMKKGFIGRRPGVEVIDEEPRPLSIKLKDGDDRLAITGSWNAMPRLARPADAANGSHAAAVSAMLKKHGIRGVTPLITGMYAVDVDGDGTDEVVISATCFQSGEELPIDARKNDYSIVLLRRPSVKQDVPVIEPFIAKKDGNPEDPVTPIRQDIMGFGDLNGDGCMEVIVRVRYYEGEGYQVVNVRSGKPVVVLSNGEGH